MRRAGRRVLINTLRWREKARDEIVFAAGRGGDDNGEAVEARERRKIGRERGDVRGRVIDGEIVAGGEEGRAGRAGKSSVRRSPSRLTASVPAFSVRNETRRSRGARNPKITWAAARVAWPHRSTSVLGVNQRSRYSPSSGTKKAVSDRLFSAAIACIRASGSQASSGHTAAGLPLNASPVTKASI